MKKVSTLFLFVSLLTAFVLFRSGLLSKKQSSFQGSPNGMALNTFKGQSDSVKKDSNSTQTEERVTIEIDSQEHILMGSSKSTVTFTPVIMRSLTATKEDTIVIADSFFL